MYNMVNTYIICPECGDAYILREEPKVIKSNTETYTYRCPDCGFVHTAKSDEDMKEEILREQVRDFIEIVDETTGEQNRWGLAMMDALGEACKKEMESWSPEELEQAKENLKKSMKVLIGVADRLYELNLSNLKDRDDFLDYYYIHELFPVKGSAVYGSMMDSITYIPKHAITAIYIELEDKK